MEQQQSYHTYQLAIIQSETQTIASSKLRFQNENIGTIAASFRIRSMLHYHTVERMPVRNTQVFS